MIKAEYMIHDRYCIIKELGKGYFGKTFEVEDTYHNNEIKVIKILNHFTDDLAKKKALELFVREFDVLKNLSHSGIPKASPDGFIGFRINSEPEYLHGLVMEKIEGQDLSKWLETNKHIQTQEIAIDWLKQLVDILAHIHAEDFLHRDIKPENIMLKPSGKLVLVDFGAVKQLAQKIQQRTVPATEIGTPGYRSPEQERQTAQKLTFKSDFFNLGRTFVHLLTGIKLMDMEIDRTGTLIWRDKAPQVSEYFKDLIDYLMQYEPTKRPQNTKEIFQIIKRIETRNYHSFPPQIVIISYLLNLILITLLVISIPPNLLLGLKVLFVVAVAVIGVFLFLL